MPRWSDHRVFLSEFFKRFHTTGAVLPSGPWLAASLVRYLDEPDGCRRILEVGPGTGAVTRRIVAALRPEDHLDLVELNDQFVAHLRDRFAHEPSFMAVADRAQIHHCPIETLQCDKPYDVIISGLPLNNFSAELVERILTILMGLLKPGGTLSFFEYIGIRSARALVSRGAERERLRGIGRALERVLQPGEIRRDWVWPNVPPAWVHHVRA
jgi:phosphatidylethanolamine/phosphatidyl-N-methylethanolamine N-methyltransferase